MLNLWISWPARRRFAAIGASALIVLLISALALHAPSPRTARASSNLIGPRPYYLALGDSLAYGFQPNHDNTHGYAQDFYQNLQQYGTTSFTDYGCPGETTYWMTHYTYCPGIPTPWPCPPPPNYVPNWGRPSPSFRPIPARSAR
jgi:hypothetical protein